MLTIKPVSNFKIRLSKQSNFCCTSNTPLNRVENSKIEVTYINNFVVCNLNST